MSDNNNNKRLKVGITIGDTNGIGIEVALKAVAVPEMMAQPRGVHRPGHQN